MRKLKNGYMSLSFRLPDSWEIPEDKVLKVIQAGSKNEKIQVEDLTQKLHIHKLIKFNREHSAVRYEHAELTTEKNVQQVLDAFYNKCYKPYIEAVRENVVSNVYLLYPWIKGYQNEPTIEVTFFTVTKYRNNERYFHIIQLITDTCDNCFEYINRVWNNPFPTITVNLDIYDYIPSELDFPKEPSSIPSLSYSSTLHNFIKHNFSLNLDIKKADIAISTVGKLTASDDKKIRKITRKSTDIAIEIAVERAKQDDYYDYCADIFRTFAGMEIYRDTLRSYRKLDRRKSLSQEDEIIKSVMRDYLFFFSKKSNYRLDIDLEKIYQDRKKDSLHDIMIEILEAIATGATKAAMDQASGA